MAEDFYSILGVNRDATADEIKKSYRKLAVKYHPDKNHGDKDAEQKFKEINAAYDILKDDQKRAAYDRYGEDAFNGMGGGQQGGFGGGGFDFSGSGSFSDIFEELFGGRGGGGHRKPDLRGSDLRHNMEVTLEESYKGESKTISVDTFSSCETCDGSGSESKKSPSDCGMCHGAGRVRVQQGFLTMEKTCSSCQGVGSIIKDPCRKCSGTGRSRKRKSLSVEIPKGIDEGMKIRLAGKGEAGIRGGTAGDLYIFISIKKHNIYIKENTDLHCKVPIKMNVAILGGEIEVPTIDGAYARIKIPAGTQSGNQFRLRDKGMPNMRMKGKFGDMYVHVEVETPINLTKKQKELIEEFAEISKKESNPESEGFLQRVKKIRAKT